MGVDTEALLVYGYRISYEQAKDLFKMCMDIKKAEKEDVELVINGNDEAMRQYKSHLENLNREYIDDFGLAGWQVKGYPDVYDDDYENYYWYIVYAEFQSYDGFKLSDIPIPTEEEIKELCELVERVEETPCEEGLKKLINLENIRLYTQLYVH
jgi:hypothetical protein